MLRMHSCEKCCGVLSSAEKSTMNDHGYNKMANILTDICMQQWKFKLIYDHFIVS